ncbi:MAG: type II toxin-antitoxin system RelE/ParE family toxin [Desulfobacterales bacterium]|nr:type II toxin-antitoxin system RelE/ParE family toxin [Desulfobacterales bacterium]
MKIKILKSAKNDLREGFYFYEFQQTGLGTYFLETLSSDIESLKLFAGTHSIHFEKYYRLLSKRFPFAVYYQLNKKRNQGLCCG